MTEQKLNISSVRKPIVVTDSTPTDELDTITVVIGMNNQYEIQASGEGWALRDVIKEAVKQLNLVGSKYMNNTRLLQNVFVNSEVVGAGHLDYVVQPGATVTVDEKKHNG